MGKININLIPKQESQESALFENIRTYKTLSITIFLFTTALLIILYLFVFIRIASLNSYTKKWKGWQPHFNEIAKIKKQIAELENSKKELERITTPDVFISKVFEDIFYALPENIWFEKLIYEKKGLNLKGYVVKLDEDYMISLDKFIKGLNSKKYFSNIFKRVNVKGSSKENFFGIEVLSFEIECLK
ncbi:MAG: hypothetical protein NC925_02620 [Candidatus Omnitrophica bacterium]|nr:hypothetical protein [Candidatus Omnitrophota bacterium]MCM8831155.1 hypothetical protein [Candidatus Omnitrophota bacterium]